MPKTIRDQLHALRKQRADNVIAGQCLDFARYNRDIGYVEGIDEAIALIEKTAGTEQEM